MTLANLYKDIVLNVDDPCTHFLYGIVYQQQYKSRDSNQCFSDGSFNVAI